MQNESDPNTKVMALPLEDTKATRLFKFMNRLAADDLRRYKREQLLYFPFFITDNQLEEFNKEINKQLDTISITESIDFVGAVRFEDLSTQRFDSFEHFLDRAGKRQDPLSIKITWSKFAIDSNGEAVSGHVELLFITEKRFKTGRDERNHFLKAKIEIIVSGSDQRWVDQLFDDLVPMAKTTAHGGIMRPLWIFQKEWFVQTIGALTTIALLIWGFKKVDKYVDITNEKEALKVLKRINAAVRIEDKLSYYFNWQLSPKPSHFVEMLASVVIVFSLGLGAFYLAYTYLPLLTPSSAVAIGTSKRRALSTADVFKFLVFTLLIGGFLVPFMRAGLIFLWEMLTK